MLEEVNACSLLLTTDPFWSAYRLSGTFEWLRPSVSNTTIFRIVLNPGLVLSFVIRIIVTLYFLAMGGLRCLILYRRNDEEWKILAEKAKAFILTVIINWGLPRTATNSGAGARIPSYLLQTGITPEIVLTYVEIRQDKLLVPLLK